jgi:hypothetical protein
MHYENLPIDKELVSKLLLNKLFDTVAVDLK